MKRLIATMLALVYLLSLTACGRKQPSFEEVEQAILEGSLTVDDALSKGWVSQQWADEYTAQRSVPATSKMDAHAVTDFVTTTLSGEEFTKEDLGDVLLLAFLDPADENAEAFCAALTEAYEGVVANGANIVVCTKSETGNEIFENAPFPVVFYNDSFREATANNREMIEGLPNAASWYVNGSFLSAWYSTVNAEELPDSAAAFASMGQEMGGASGGMAVMG